MPPSYRQALGIGDDCRLEVTPGDEYVVCGNGWPALVGAYSSDFVTFEVPRVNR